MTTSMFQRGPCAEVRAHGQVTRYRCTGSGRPLLYLEPACDGGFPSGPLVDALAVHCRVILPETPADVADRTGWLAHFLEGLGVVSVGIVAAGSFCMPALGLALLEPEQVERIALLPGGAGHRLWMGGALQTNGPGAGIPLLIVEGDTSEEFVARVARFLTEGSPGVA